MITGIWATRQVFIDGRELDPRPSQESRSHSPDGFSWGYGGSGPAQLALALLLLHLPEPEAVRLHQDFKWEVIARLPQSDFELTVAKVKNWVKEAP